MTFGPASALLEQELAQEIRRQGIVVWLDRDKSFTTFVDRLAERHAAGTFEHPVVGFRGSFLELLFALETRGSGYDRNPLLIHMPGFNEEAIRGHPGAGAVRGRDTLPQGPGHLDSPGGGGAHGARRGGSLPGRQA